MSTKLKYGALAVLVGAGMGGAAQADTAETKGGITLKTSDGRFEAKVGGRIHFDGNLFIDDEDLEALEEPADETSSSFFRRARITLEGKAYGWTYKFENDFAGQSSSSGSGFREMWIGTRLGPANFRLGQAKPYRGMEELTSSNEILFMERPYATATGVYEGDQFTQGLFFDGSGRNWTWGVAAYNLRTADGPETEGVGGSARATFAPVMSETMVVHLGAIATLDKPHNDSEVVAGAKPAGRLSSTEELAVSTDERQAFGGELALRAGAFYAQAEYVTADFAAEEGAGEDQSVDTYYVQASYFITGETKPYDGKKGVFKSPKPKAAYGAWELKLRYDVMENSDVDDAEVTQLAAGVNWYVNPNVRFMLEYLDGQNEAQDVGLRTLAARAQYSF